MSALIHPKTITVDGLSVRYAEGGQDGPDAVRWPLVNPDRLPVRVKPANRATLLLGRVGASRATVRQRRSSVAGLRAALVRCALLGRDRCEWLNMRTGCWHRNHAAWGRY